MGAFGKTVEDAAAAVTPIAGDDEKNYWVWCNGGLRLRHVLSGSETPYESLVSKMDSPKGARFGMPWKQVWESASEKEYPYNMLMKMLDQIRQAGAEVYEHTDFPSAEEIISPGLWG